MADTDWLFLNGAAVLLRDKKLPTVSTWNIQILGWRSRVLLNKGSQPTYDRWQTGGFFDVMLNQEVNVVYSNNRQDDRWDVWDSEWRRDLEALY